MVVYSLECELIVADEKVTKVACKDITVVLIATWSAECDSSGGWT